VSQLLQTVKGAKDAYYIALCNQIAAGSKCLKAQYGAVIVGTDGHVKGMGYNGKPKGATCDGVCFRMNAEVGGEECSHECCIHAERNAIMFTDPADRQGATMYVNGLPCQNCALAIMQSGIRVLVYLDDTQSKTGKRLATDEFWERYGSQVTRIPYRWEITERSEEMKSTHVSLAEPATEPEEKGPVPPSGAEMEFESPFPIPNLAPLQQEIKIFRKPFVELPKYETAGSAAVDLAFNRVDVFKGGLSYGNPEDLTHFVTTYEIHPGDRVLAKTGIYLGLSEAVDAHVQPRSGLALKHGLTVLNSPGEVDPR